MSNPEEGVSPGAEVAARIAAAKRTAARLVAQGESELMLARADAARIQAEARLQLAQAKTSGQTFQSGEPPPANGDEPFQMIEEARRQATEIVAKARMDARRILEEAKLLLESSRQRAGSTRPDGSSEASSPPEPDAGLRRQPVEPDVVVDDRDTYTRARPTTTAP